MSTISADFAVDDPSQTAYVLENEGQSRRKRLETLLADGKVPDIPWLPPVPTRPAEYPVWELEVLAHRFRIIAETSGSDRDKDVARARDREERRCRQSMPYLVATYGAIYEARPEENDVSDDTGGLTDGFMLPFVPYPFQVRLLYLFELTLLTIGRGQDLCLPKSRDMGVSNTICFAIASYWLVKPVFSARVLSRVEDLVDETGNPDALFWKIEMFLAGLPGWLFDRLAPGFRWTGPGKHRQDMKFVHPVSHNQIIGESTTANAGRGGRATLIFYDEGAFMDGLAGILSAGRDSTRHRIICSTVSTEKGQTFKRIHKQADGDYGSFRVEELHYYLHPFHDDAWLANERLRDDSGGVSVAREILMDYLAGVGAFIYPLSHDIKPGDFPFLPGAGHLYCTWDNGFDDDFAIAWIQFIRETGRLRVFQTFNTHHRTTDFIGSILKGVPESQFERFYDDNSMRILRRQLILPPMTYTCDSHMNNVEEIVGESPWERLAGKYGIHAHMEFGAKRAHNLRWKALNELLPLMDFHDADHGADALEALQRRRLPEQRGGSDQRTEYKEPIHDDDSHIATALEWFAIAWPTIRYSNEAGTGFKYRTSSHN